MYETQPIKTDGILLAVDGSLSTKSAAYTAAQFASALHWSICAEYIVDVTQVFEVYGDTHQELSEFGGVVPRDEQIILFEEQGTLALAEIESLCQEMDVPVTSEMIFGGIPEMFLTTSKEYELLALGRRGNHHHRDSHHLGSNFRQIVHHIQIPMLIGGSFIEQRKIQNVLLAYGGSDFSRIALSWIEDVQWMFQKVTVLSVEKEHEKDHSWLDERHHEILHSALSQYTFIGKRGEPGFEVASTALATQADLILMGAYRHGQILEWAGHSVLDTVLHEINLPVLAAK